MACWKEEMVTILRCMINDVGTPPIYTDVRLQEILLIAAKFVMYDVSLCDDYAIDITALDFTPDPVENTDTGFVNLTLLKAACLTAQAEFKTASGQGIAIRDGSSSIDLRGTLDGKKQLTKIFCDTYEDAVFQVLATGKSLGPNSCGTSNIPGEAIVGPYRFHSYNYGSTFN